MSQVGERHVIVEYDSDRDGEYVLLTYMGDQSGEFRIPIDQALDVADGIAGIAALATDTPGNPG